MNSALPLQRMGAPGLPWGLCAVIFAAVLAAWSVPLGAAPATPPPEPADYFMGNITNGDFEADGGSLDGWTLGQYCESPYETVVPMSLDGGNFARAHAHGEWWRTFWWRYSSGNAYVEQEVYVPLDASAVSLTYYTEETTQVSGDPAAFVTIGNIRTDLLDAPTWARSSVPVPESVKGTFATIKIGTSDNGQGTYDTYPRVVNTADFYFDYVGLDGTQQLLTAAWTAAGGGAWGDPANWSTGTVPDNGPPAAYRVEIPDTAGGGAITLSANREVMSFVSTRSAGALEIQGGGGLNVRENTSFSGGELRILPGGGATFSEDLWFSGTRLVIHPDGNPAGGAALTVGDDLRLGLIGAVLGEASTVCDATVSSDSMRVFDRVELSKSAGFAGQPELRATRYAYIGSGGHIVLGPGTAIVTPRLTISGSSPGIPEFPDLFPPEPGGKLTVHSATVGDLSPGYTTNNGTMEFIGPDCLFDQDRLDNYGVLQFTDATVRFTGDLNVRTTAGPPPGPGEEAPVVPGDAALVRSDVTVDGYMPVYGAVSADAASTLCLKGGLSLYGDPSDSDLTPATVAFEPTATEYLSVGGLDCGPFSTGLNDNHGIGRLEVLSGELRFSGTFVEAQYVRDLYVAPGATLNLRSVPLYYLGSVTNLGTITGGEPMKTDPRPDGLPTAQLDATGLTVTLETCHKDHVSNTLPAEAREDLVMAMMPGWAQASADCRTAGDAMVLTLHVDGEPSMEEWWDPMMPEMPPEFMIMQPSQAGSRVEAPLLLPASALRPEGSLVETLFTTRMRGHSWGAFWYVEIYDGTDLLLHLDDAQTSGSLMLTAGSDSLRIDAMLEAESGWDVWSSYFNEDLALTIATTPEPGTLFVLSVGGLVLCRRKRRRQRQNAAAR